MSEKKKSAFGVSRWDLGIFLLLVGVALVLATVYFFMPKEIYIDTLRGSCDFVNSSLRTCEVVGKDIHFPLWAFR